MKQLISLIMAINMGFFTGCDTRFDEKLAVSGDSIILEKTQPDYATVLQAIEKQRDKLSADYQAESSSIARLRIRNEARLALVMLAQHQLFPQWLGTPWDFNGMTEQPNSGKIACGYFVTTILRDLGISLQRIRLAQEPSETMIKALVSEDYIKRFSHASLQTFLSEIESWGSGLYVVGLDFHTGFMLHDGETIWFIHASYVYPKAVIKEKAKKSAILRASNYRVLGKLSADDGFIDRWLRKK